MYNITNRVKYHSREITMPRFFIQPDQIDQENGTVTLTGADAHHIARSLRMAAGETVTVCDATHEYDCVLETFHDEREVIARITEVRDVTTEPPFVAHLYQALPKGDKLDNIIQKAVECGVNAVTPFESAHCIVRIKAEAEAKKTERRRRIALEAAKQCGRGSIPEVSPSVSFSEALTHAAEADLALFCYEGEGTQPLRTVISSFAASNPKGKMPRITLMVGSEGGFSPAEAQAARDAGMIPVGLGRRILRTETAAAFVLACLVYEWEL
jgi:16S rRNA (uracil1498-N3)-methyltransferase